METISGENGESIESVENIGSAENIENIENVESVENIGSVENIESIENDNVPITQTTEMSFELICDIIEREDIINIADDSKQNIISFLLHFYKTYKCFGHKEIVNLNNFLKSIITKFKEENENVFFERLLFIHIENMSNRFINVKLKHDPQYIEQIELYFFFILDLSFYFKNTKTESSFSKLTNERVQNLVIAIVNNLTNFLVYALRMIESNYYKDLYLMLISKGKVIDSLTNLYLNYDQSDKYIIYILLILSRHKEFDDDIINCGIIDLFNSQIFLNNNDKVDNKHYFFIEIIINVVIRNQKDSIAFLVSKNELGYVNNILENILIKIKKESPNLTCISLLKLIFYIIQNKNSYIHLFLLGLKKNILHDQDISFVHNLNNIIDCIENILVFKNEGIENFDNFIDDFLCILFCILRTVMKLILCPSSEINLDSCIDPYGMKEDKESTLKDDISSEVGETKNVCIKLIKNIIKFSLNFLCHDIPILDGEKKSLHLVCADILKEIGIYDFSGHLEDKKKIVNEIIESIMTKMEETKNISNEDQHIYVYSKHLEVVFYVSFNNEELIKMCFTKEFILLVHNNYCKLDKNENLKNIKKKEIRNLLKVYYFGILYLYIKNNLQSEEIKTDPISSYIYYVINKELKDKQFMLQNELYYLIFLKFLSMSLLNNLYNFELFLKNNTLDNLLRTFKRSTIRMKSVVQLLFPCIENDDNLELVKNYTKKNKLLLEVLMSFWIEIQKSSLDKKEYMNAKYMIYYICKLITDSFTKYLKHFYETKAMLSSLKSMIVYEEKCVLDIYLKIKEEIETSQLAVVENDEWLVKEKIKNKIWRIEHMEAESAIIQENNYKKEKKELDNYYDYVRNTK
ncbi:conserved Plasmodium protein, unknown function [Plasmodium chabaudi chabaudi]|uniref:Uncharacterized protein n=1 Tax=Plasmodium chabaudi chabaudi TaxID=31271 RepID=A0A4V0K628_PLACU|nr:conserved Plasmodium protein, unknown function [Plasmodium chabaudi chabaudi]VTZ67935.1 conserved Plasmodium protein, unknown function [Plasmodium chabaudi chabaudi]|eukprot:XP_016653550.1 conserved Plasmodium protein, unknown function [Plasmodium chabaudi chabaudi]